MKKLTIFFISLLISFSSTHIFAEENTQQIEFQEGELAQMLAPIALYPDSVLTHILIASTYPLEIIQANRWANKNKGMDPGDALKKVENKDWDPSVKALIPFPRILEKLSDDLEWTQKLGDAFLQDEKQVLEAIQALRWKADEAGNLDKMEKMEISREDDKIIIQPVEKEVVYVPYYDTRVVYGSWYWHRYPPVYWNWHWHNHHHYAHHGLYRWHPRVHISFNYFFSAFHWHNHHVVVLDHHHYHSRRYYHRRHIIRHNNARRWVHNPSHRRGVAYRTEHVRQRYHSNRPSVSQTRAIRRNEQTIVSTRNNGTRNRQSSVSTSRGDRLTATNSSRPRVTRQEQLRRQLNTNRTRQVQSSRNDTVNRRNSDSRANRTNRETLSNNRQRAHSQRSNVQRSNVQRSNSQRSNVQRSNVQRSNSQRSNVQRSNRSNSNRDKRANRVSSQRSPQPAIKHSQPSRNVYRSQPVARQSQARSQSASKSNYRASNNRSSAQPRRSESSRRSNSHRSSNRQGR
ncbi:DUF3300 domain-containing protein [Aliikangiella coralliicola]|uniref:DUF3300 domain-containing protein n=1 Tax=Aliikangiella coralliicola TaxID=2592383 RepID=A0A545UAB3_9GAMM|nr:DUF3300 domain-containing protein [Aliikangiella coralliicola]TQV86415.1 DUF3300 domain-containing protein [Aliikangiella coralliicola]